MICGLAPLLLAKKFQWVSAEEAGNLKSTNRVVMTLLSFGGGVLLSTTFMHLMPEVDHNVVYLQSEYLFSYIRPLVRLLKVPKGKA
ncbi:Zinc/iron transporter [Operophtera brumata]|uniref:Zinc/iron transporter n=1 Tax=Operophtera brumata TaxID=104452 RepID=A0A0L7LQ86_OPEBR|nr:Zinc/iron transporter [Operophtera brumata]